MNDYDMLRSICKTAEMGVDSIKDLMGYVHEPQARKVLSDQKAEYNQIYSKAYAMLLSCGKQPKDVSRMAKMGASMAIKAETMRDRSMSKVAELLIKGNTTGMTKSIKNMRNYRGQNEGVRTLAAKLLRTEQANIEQMKSYL